MELEGIELLLARLFEREKNKLDGNNCPHPDIPSLMGFRARALGLSQFPQWFVYPPLIFVPVELCYPDLS